VERQNANAALVFEFMYRFINLGRSYFGKLDEESVKNNFVFVFLARLLPASSDPYRMYAD
jgi:AP-2 complex subunit mu-1